MICNEINVVIFISHSRVCVGSASINLKQKNYIFFIIIFCLLSIFIKQKCCFIYEKSMFNLLFKNALTSKMYSKYNLIISQSLNCNCNHKIQINWNIRIHAKQRFKKMELCITTMKSATNICEQCSKASDDNFACAFSKFCDSKQHFCLMNIDSKQNMMIKKIQFFCFKFIDAEPTYMWMWYKYNNINFIANHIIVFMNY